MATDSDYEKESDVSQSRTAKKKAPKAKDKAKATGGRKKKKTPKSVDAAQTAPASRTRKSAARQITLSEARTLMTSVSTAVFERESARVSSSRLALDSSKKEHTRLLRELDSEQNKIHTCELRFAAEDEKHRAAMKVQETRAEEFLLQLQVEELKARSEHLRSLQVSELY
ncbi:hypothetical protein C8R44DRAFT_746618 [Mycena epipterygia]|nr:hypothetical protein C8R44DRAFT_746618 [Mycena epipterygia]